MIGSTKIIDFHAHILPGADHGSSDANETAGQIALLNNAGVDTVVATPHFYPNRHTLEYFLGKVDASLEKFGSLDIPRPKICLGAEVLYCDGLDNMQSLEKLCIRGTNVLLLELPLDTWDDRLYETVKELLGNYTIVLAHIDRYISWQEDGIYALLEMGALAQINAQGLFFKKEKKHLTPLIEGNKICAIGSDLHNLDKKLMKRFTESQKKLGDAYIQIMRSSDELLKDAVII